LADLDALIYRRTSLASNSGGRAEKRHQEHD
jgi:hypothetical protein